MELKSIETRDELGLVAFGPRSRVFEVGANSTSKITLDIASRIVWLHVQGQEVPHGIPLEQVRRFTPTENPAQATKAPAAKGAKGGESK